MPTPASVIVLLGDCTQEHVAGRDPQALPSLSESFTRQVLWKLLTLVKFGETVSYQQLAALAGNPRAARAVGGAMRSNPVSVWLRGSTRPQSAGHWGTALRV